MPAKNSICPQIGTSTTGPLNDVFGSKAPRRSVCEVVAFSDGSTAGRFDGTLFGRRQRAGRVRRTGGVTWRSGRAPFVSMMEAADLWVDAAIAGPGNRTRNRRVFVERQVRSGPFVVGGIEAHQPLQSRFVEHDDVIQTDPDTRDERITSQV